MLVAVLINVCTSLLLFLWGFDNAYADCGNVISGAKTLLQKQICELDQFFFFLTYSTVRNEGASKIGEVEFVGVLTTYDEDWKEEKTGVAHI